MAIILGIETSSESGSVAIVSDGKALVSIHFNQTNAHGRILSPAILQALAFAEIELKDVSAVAVSAGPGSYTGLRIGASTAKGLCYGLGIPLVAVSTLQAMAAQVVQFTLEPDAVYAPMLDARRMEIFTAAYDEKLKTISAPAPVILTDGIPFSNLDPDKRVYYFGPGAAKCQEILNQEHRFQYLNSISPSAEMVASLGETLFLAGKTVDSALFEPDYLKAFQGKPPAKPVQ